MGSEYEGPLRDNYGFGLFITVADTLCLITTPVYFSLGGAN